MLQLTIDLFPGGSTQGRRTLATMRIGNLSDLADLSDYEVTMLEAANPLNGAPARMSSFLVEGHDRRQSVWRLVAAAIDAARGAEPVDL